MNIKLPNFLVVGAAKAGTTSLYYYLKEHPEIFLPEIKEPKFITSQIVRYPFKGIGDELVEKGIIKKFAEYIDLFSDSNNATAIGEFSADTLYYYDKSIGIIKRYLGEPKILIILRNPIERAYSAYIHLLRDDRESFGFMAALANEETRKNANWEFIWFYKDVGLYYKQVKAYLENFDLVKIYLFDDLKKDTLGFVQDICRFLGVEDSFVPTSISEKFNVSGVPKNRFLQRFLLHDNTFRKILRPAVRFLMPDGEKRQKIVLKLQQGNLKKEPMPSEAREYLRDFFKEDILMLQDLIRRDLSHWLD